MIGAIMEDLDPDDPATLLEIEIKVATEEEMSRYEAIDQTLVIALD